MARPLDLRQQEELSHFVNALFVNALFDAADFETTAEWARQSDYPASNLSNLRNGKGGVDGYNPAQADSSCCCSLWTDARGTRTSDSRGITGVDSPPPGNADKAGNSRARTA